MSDNKYKLFRNYMVNELGISREDIKEWAMQAVKEAVEKELRGLNLEKLINDVADRQLHYSFSNYGQTKELLAAAIYKLAAEKVDLTIRQKE